MAVGGEGTIPAYIIPDMCSGCGQCAPSCPHKAISVCAGQAVVDPGLCDECEACVFACINGAVTMK
ncbi:MAG: 4Fe-4S binding protein [Peptococcaceae bacterium]|nr:4Fe-4S binding protein [Peptococcaceae bacterium]